MSPTIPAGRTICVSCAADLAMLGERECPKCLFETRLGNHLMGDSDALPPGLRFAGEGETKSFVPADPVAYRPCPCGCSRAHPVYEAPGEFPAPRITEAPQPRKVPATHDRWAALPQASPLPPSAEAQTFARRAVPWIGLLLLVTFAAGWALGSFSPHV
jgi:hypothetical protein